ncbi:MAG: WG repeat-containing protein [Deltaproteobacteria bacterium]|nr:WG repeat-containing protein [Deltaproteobacteria bacterium]
MKKGFAVIVTFFFFAINPHAVFAKNNTVRFMPSCGGPFDKCGFVRIEGFERKEEIIPKNYEAAIEFSEGLAGVRIKGRWGFINMKGDIIIAPQFDLVGSFTHDLAEVLIDGKIGVINRQGELVIKPQFSRAIPFSKNIVLAEPGDWRSIHFRDHEKLENIKNIISFSSGLYGLYSAQSGWITKPEWEFIIFDRTGKISLIWAKHKGRNSLYGLMRPDGSWQVEPRYDHVQTLDDERAVVSEKEELKPGQVERDRQSLRGAVDPEGKLIVPLRPWGLSYWGNGFAPTRDPETQKEGLLDKAGNLVGGRFFDQVSRGKNGIGEVMIDGVWHGIDQQGNIVAHPRENEVVKECPSGLKLVYFSGKLQFMDLSSNPTVPYLLDTISQFDCHKITSVRYNGKWGYVNRKGHLLFDPPEFNTQYDFIDGYAAVQKNKKWGIINEQGKFSVQPIYDELRYVGNSIFKATLAGKDLWINTEGIEQTEPEQEAIDRTAYLLCPGELQLIPNNANGDLWGMGDKNNNVIIKPLYRAIHCFQKGVAWVPNDAKRQWCPVDPNGIFQDYPKCVTSRYPYIQTHSYPEEFSDDSYESSVLWSRAFLEFGAGLRKKPPRMIGDGIRGGASYSIIL